jgi:hypothetical protein
MYSCTCILQDQPGDQGAVKAPCCLQQHFCQAYASHKTRRQLMTTLQTSAGVTGPSCKLVSWLSRSAASLAQLVVNIIAADPDDHIERHQMIDVCMQCILTNIAGAVSTVSQGHCGSHRRSEELPRSTGQHAAPLLKPRLC